MKVTIAYIDEDKTTAEAVEAAVMRLVPTAKVHRSSKHPPFKHIYLSVELNIEK